MKITTSVVSVNPSRELVVCFDVSLRSLNLYTRYEKDGRTFHFEDELPNATDSIENALDHLALIAADAGLEGLCVVSEPTGGFERKLLKTARRLGHKSALVSAEHVAQLKKVESNDTGKTDHKDPRVMHLVVRLGKTQRDRLLPPIYARLRQLNAFYDDEERALASCKTHLFAIIQTLFPDFDKTAHFTFSTSGDALAQAYAFNPYRIVRAGRRRFSAAMKRRVPNIRTSTLEHLFACAELSVRHEMDADELHILESRFQSLWHDVQVHRGRMAALRQQITDLGAELKAAGHLPPLDEHISGVTLFALARIAGETGPLSDFHSSRALLRYAGLNIRERSSGTFKGKCKISKKGRALLRKVLGQAVFPLIKRKALYGRYYHGKRGHGAIGSKVRVAVMRKFLVMLYSLALSGDAFDPVRLRWCESQWARAA